MGLLLGKGQQIIMERPIVINLDSMLRLGNDEAIFKMVSEQGFQYFDYPLYWKGVTDHIGLDKDYKEKALAVKNLALKYGLTCRQTHATMMNSKDEEGLLKEIEMISKEIEISSLLGAKGTVIHPNPNFDKKKNANIFKKYFVPLAHKFNINILIENTFTWNGKINPMCSSTPDDLLDLLNLINDDYVGACVDIGHAALAELKTSPEEMLRKLNKKVYALHLHDNDTRGDTHQMLYTGYININKVLETLKEISYKGDITFEILTCYNRGYDHSMELPEALFPAYLKLEYEIGKYFASYLDN